MHGRQNLRKPFKRKVDWVANLSNPRRAARRRSSTGIKIHALYKFLHLQNCISFVLLSCTDCRRSVRVSLNNEAETHDMYTHKHPQKRMERKEEKNEKQRKKVIKISGRNPRGQTSKQLQHMPHQYENEPAVTVAAVRLPWHFGCLEDVRLQCSVCVHVRGMWKNFWCHLTM